MSRLLASVIAVAFYYGCGSDPSSYLNESHTQPLVLISDIDDTIRLSGGGSIFRKIRSGIRSKDMTFYGFSEVYSEVLSHLNRNTKVFYVTGAPITPVVNIFKIVKNSVIDGGFPGGEFIGRKPGHDLYEYKMQHHKRIIEDHPHSEILLLGDDTSKDETVYTDLQKFYPDRNIHFLIHLVDNKSELSEDQSRYLTAPDLGMSLYSRNFLSKKSLLSIFDVWMKGYKNKKVRDKRIFPKWMNCSGFPGYFRHSFAREPKLENLKDKFDLYDSKLLNHCDF